MPTASAFVLILEFKVKLLYCCEPIGLLTECAKFPYTFTPEARREADEIDIIWILVSVLHKWFLSNESHTDVLIAETNVEMTELF